MSKSPTGRPTSANRCLAAPLAVAGITLLGAFLWGCSGASRGAYVQGPYLHPTLTLPSRPLAAATPYPPSDKVPEEKTPPTDPRDAEAPVSPSSYRGDTGGYQLPTTGSNLDLLRTEVVRSARRLLRIRRSFDDISFLGHVLRINALLPDDARSATFFAAKYLSLSRSAGRLVPAREALPGDIVFFRCDEECGSVVDGTAAGVVERVYGNRLEFIAYLDHTVRRCFSGGRGRKKGLREVTGLLGVASVGK